MHAQEQHVRKDNSSLSEALAGEGFSVFVMKKAVHGMAHSIDDTFLVGAQATLAARGACHNGRKLQKERDKMKRSFDQCRCLSDRFIIMSASNEIGKNQGPWRRISNTRHMRSKFTTAENEILSSENLQWKIKIQEHQSENQSAKDKNMRPASEILRDRHDIKKQFVATTFWDQTLSFLPRDSAVFVLYVVDLVDEMHVAFGCFAQCFRVEEQGFTPRESQV